MNARTIGSSLLLIPGLLASAPLAANPLANSTLSGLFRRTESDPREHPLPPFQKLEALADAHSFQIRDLRGGQFVFQVLAGHPGSTPSALKDLGAELTSDGKTLVAPVDLTGSGVSDLIYARKDSAGFQVLSNGTRLPHPFQGFVAGFYPKDQETAQTAAIAVDTHDLVVDPNLLTVVGDFLGNGTEQLAYTRPGWSQIWVVGAHGAIQMAADLQGIEASQAGERVHWLFAFKPAKGTRHTRIAYYRKGCTEMPTFTPKGMTFKRDQAPLKGNWEKLQQTALDWPQPAPAQAGAETKADAGATGETKVAQAEPATAQP